MELYLAPTSPEATAAYQAIAAAYLARPYTERDAGFDVVAAAPLIGAKADTARIDLGTRAAVWDPARRHFRAFTLMPRSSISKTPLRMANSVGLIDAGYRGPLMGAVDFRGDHQVAVGDRYFQVVAADLLPFTAIHIVSEIPGGPTIRGEGGFGSTGVGGAEPNVSYFG